VISNEPEAPLERSPRSGVTHHDRDVVELNEVDREEKDEHREHGHDDTDAHGRSGSRSAPDAAEGDAAAEEDDEQADHPQNADETEQHELNDRRQQEREVVSASLAEQRR
jgi:hypothetical protein